MPDPIATELIHAIRDTYARKGGDSFVCVGRADGLTIAVALSTLSDRKFNRLAKTYQVGEIRLLCFPISPKDAASLLKVDPQVKENEIGLIVCHPGGFRFESVRK